MQRHTWLGSHPLWSPVRRGTRAGAPSPPPNTPGGFDGDTVGTNLDVLDSAGRADGDSSLLGQPHQVGVEGASEYGQHTGAAPHLVAQVWGVENPLPTHAFDELVLLTLQEGEGLQQLGCHKAAAGFVPRHLLLLDEKNPRLRSRLHQASGRCGSGWTTTHHNHIIIWLQATTPEKTAFLLLPFFLPIPCPIPPFQTCPNFISGQSRHPNRR